MAFWGAGGTIFNIKYKSISLGSNPPGDPTIKDFELISTHFEHLNRDFVSIKIIKAFSCCGLVSS